MLNEYLQPQSGVGVVITGHDVVLTDAAGHFTVTGVTRPYELATSLLADHAAMVYAGLTRADPLVMVPAHPLVDPTYGAYVGGMIQGVDPLLAYHETSAWFESPEVGVGARVESGAYTAGPRWGGVSSTQGAVHALYWQVDSVTWLPSSYAAYGSRAPVALVNGGSLGGQDIQMGPVETQSVRGAVAVPDGYMPPPVNIYVFTTDTVATIPDLNPLGLWSYPGAKYAWNVFAWAPIGSLDDILVPTWFVPQGNAHMAVSASRSFNAVR